jgi:hypothetical protein
MRRSLLQRCRSESVQSRIRKDRRAETTGGLKRPAGSAGFATRLCGWLTPRRHSRPLRGNTGKCEGEPLVLKVNRRVRPEAGSPGTARGPVPGRGACVERTYSSRLLRAGKGEKVRTRMKAHRREAARKKGSEGASLERWSGFRSRLRPRTEALAGLLIADMTRPPPYGHNAARRAWTDPPPPARAQSTVTTILPICSLLSMKRCASTICSNENVLAMTGFSAPLASPSSTYCRPFAIRAGSPTISNNV